jgi:hypothetical protein
VSPTAYLRPRPSKEQISAKRSALRCERSTSKTG